MAGFKDLHSEDFVILASKGTYRQCSLATLPGGGLYAKLGSSYIRLYANKETSNASQRILVLEMVGKLYVDRFGRLSSNLGKRENQRKELTPDELEYLRNHKE